MFPLIAGIASISSNAFVTQAAAIATTTAAAVVVLNNSNRREGSAEASSSDRHRQAEPQLRGTREVEWVPRPRGHQPAVIDSRPTGVDIMFVDAAFPVDYNRPTAARNNEEIISSPPVRSTSRGILPSLCDDKFSDIEFVLLNDNGKEEKIKGHRNVFGAASDVFEAMLYGSQREGDVIKITDINVDAFKSLKKYIYLGTVEFSSVDHAINVYKVADKYHFKELLEEAYKYLSVNITPKDVFKIFYFSKLYEKGSLEESCLHLIRNDTRNVLNSDDFLSIGLDLLCLIVDDDKLNMKEVDLFNKVDLWARAHSAMTGESDNEKIRKGLNEVVNKIRFFVMTPQEFTNIRQVNNSSLLTVEERLMILTNLINPGSCPVPSRFCTKKTLRMNSSGDFSTRLHNETTTLHWVIKGVSSLVLDKEYCSPLAIIKGLKFRLIVVPSKDNGEHMITIYVQCCSDFVLCKVECVRRYFRKEGLPETRKSTFTLTPSSRNAGGCFYLADLVNNRYLNCDCLTTECDLKIIECV